MHLAKHQRRPRLELKNPPHSDNLHALYQGNRGPSGTSPLAGPRRGVAFREAGAPCGPQAGLELDEEAGLCPLTPPAPGAGPGGGGGV